ncbi:hypothetical protein [Alkaliphilus transvaalensis]|uniref:hypothetical protein n=1 Tax=Alkaliphilus transvaalensis TaxID=114628 RepID=UPI000479D95B|nr:hypothetical protein [Alkaliphilus transvaalensis]
MKNNTKRTNTVIMIVMMIFILSTTFSFAHKMTVTEIEDGKIQVLYGDGSFPTFGEVVLYTEDYIEVYRGNINEEGIFIIPQEVNAYLLVANDGMGHQARWKIGDNTSNEGTNVIKVIVIAMIFVSVAGLYQIKLKKKANL